MRDGDFIALDVPARTLTLEVSDAELAARKAAWTQAPRPVERGYLSLFLNEVTQANEGCDFRFLHRNGHRCPSQRFTEVADVPASLSSRTAAQCPDGQIDEGDFERQEDAFRNWVSEDPHDRGLWLENQKSAYR